MSRDTERPTELIEFVQSDEAIPMISVVLIGILLIYSGIGYRLLESTSMLLFYAVLVRMWTSMTPSDSELLRGSFAHPVFLIMSAGAVAIGFFIEELVGSLSGSMLPAQFLALAVLISKLYLNYRQSESLPETFLWEDKQDRYLVLIPCLVVILLPIAVYQSGSSNLFFVNIDVLVSRTGDSLLYLTLLGIGIGVALYAIIEEESPKIT